MCDKEMNTQSGLPPYNVATASQDAFYPSVPPMPTDAVQQQPQVVIMQSMPVFGPRPQKVTCPSCNKTLISEVRVEPSSKTHLLAAVLCLITGCCCCVPYCIDSCQSKNHHCSKCGAYLGAYQQ